MNASTEDGEETRKVDFQLCHVTNIIELKIDCNPFILLHLQDSGRLESSIILKVTELGDFEDDYDHFSIRVKGHVFLIRKIK